MERNAEGDAFEGSVKKGKEDRLSVQKRTFTRWVNSHLIKKEGSKQIEDIFIDLRDGVILLDLLQIITGDVLPKPDKGKAAQAPYVKAANVGKSLDYLKKKKVQMENIGPNDIVDGHPSLTLGLLWTLILRFQIQDISVDELSAKDALLLWVKKKTKGYPGVSVNDFHKSFRDGLVFNALIHAHRPDLIKYNALKPDEWVVNLNNAFSTAQDKLGIYSLLDATDVAVERPDEKSIMTYVAALYHYFSSMAKEDVASQRVSNMVQELDEIQALEEDYDRRVGDLLTWIKENVDQLDERDFPNTLAGVQGLQGDFKGFLTNEKPPKIKEKGELEAQFFNIQSKLRSINRPRYSPAEGKSVNDVNQAWAVLETAEHDREVALNEELTRLQKLEEAANRFNKKDAILGAWLTETEKLVADNEESTNAGAALKKHEAIMADAAAHEERVKKLLATAKYLDSEDYRGKDEINAHSQALEVRWNKLNEDLLTKHEDLNEALKLQEFYDELKQTLDLIKLTKTAASSQHYGDDLESVDDLIKSHHLAESDVTTAKEKTKALDATASKLVAENNRQSRTIQDKMAELKRELEELEACSQDRLEKLEKSRVFFDILARLEDEDIWIQEIEPTMKSTDYGKDQTSSQNMLKRHDVILASIRSHEGTIKPVLSEGHEISKSDHFRKEEIADKTKAVEKRWEDLQVVAKDRREKLEAAVLSQQYYAAADDADQFIAEKEPLLDTNDLGHDEDSARELLKRHQELLDELESFEFDMNALRALNKKLVDKQNHESENAAKRQEEIEAKWAGVKEKAAARKRALEDADRFHKFNRDADDFIIWAENKETFLQEAQLSDKLDNLDVLRRKFDEVDRDFAQHEIKHKELNADADAFVKEDHPSKDSVTDKQQAVNESWDKLNKDMTAKRDELQDAVDAAELLSAVTDLNDLLKQKEKAASSEDFGKDLPSALAQKKKQDALNRDIAEIAAKVAAFDDQTKKFVADHPDSKAAAALGGTQKDLEENLEKVQGLANDRTKKLDDAVELQKFLADVFEADQLLAQKDQETDTIEKPKDMRGAEAGLRKLDKLQKAVEANDDRLKHIQEAGEKLAAAGHPAAGEIKEKLEKLAADRSALGEKQAAKEKELLGVYDLEKFREDLHDVDNWIADKKREADSEEMPKDTADAQKMIKRAEDLKNETEGYADNIKKVEQQGLTLVAANHPEKEAINEMLQKLTADHKALGDAVDHRKKKLDESLSLLAFDRDAQEIEDWLDEAQANMASNEKPESVEAAEEMLKKNEALLADIKLEAQKVKALDQTATKLVGEDHYAKDHIGDRRDKIMDRWNSLDAGLAAQKKDLENAIKLQQFLKDSDELMASLNDRDEDLDSKKKKLEALKKALEALEGNEGFDADAARKKLAEIDELMASLSDESEKAAKQNKEAASLQQIDRDFNDLDLWFREVEAIVASEDLGADLGACQALLKKHSGVEADIKVHESPVQKAQETAQALIEADHHASEALKQKKDALAARYAALQDKAKEKRAKLDDSLKQHKFLRDVEEERQYVQYKITLASSPDYGRDAAASQALLSKHKVLAEEVENHEKTVYVPLKATGEKVLAEKTVPTEQVSAALTTLDGDWEKLKALLKDREQALAENSGWLDFKADQDDELHWIDQQIRVLEAAEHPGDSQTTCSAMNKKNESLLNDIKTHEALVLAVCEAGDALIATGNNHSDDVKEAQAALKARLDTLKDLAAKRKALLYAARQRQQFSADAGDLQSFIKDAAETLAAPVGEGTNTTKQLESLKDLEVKIDAEAAQMAKLSSTKDALAAANHPEKDVIEKKHGEVSKEWDELKLKQTERKRMLTQKQGDFKSADEKCLAVAEKAAALNNWIDNTSEDLADPVQVNSVEEAKALQKAHDDFQNSLQKPTNNYEEVVTLDKEITSLGLTSNPYTPFTVDALTEKWGHILSDIEDRTDAIDKEIKHQEENDKLRKEFAELANAFAKWMETVRETLLDGGSGSLEDQLEATRAKNKDLDNKGEEIGKIEALGQKLEAALILDNKYTEHSAISLQQKLEALRQLGTTMIYNIEQKLLSKNTVGVSDAQRKEWSDTFDYFDKDKSDSLDYIEFRACLRGSGYNLPIVPEGQKDPEYEQILAFVDGDASGKVSKQEFIDFMISQKTTTVTSAADVASSFMMIAQDRPYVTEYQLRQILPADQVDYCLRNMKKTQDGYDYKSFVNTLFENDDKTSSEPPTPTQNKDLAAVRAEKLKALETERIKKQEESDTSAKELKKNLEAEKLQREALRKEELKKAQEEADARREAALQEESNRKAAQDTRRKRLQEDMAKERPTSMMLDEKPKLEKRASTLFSDSPFTRADRERRATRDLTAASLAGLSENKDKKPE